MLRHCSIQELLEVRGGEGSYGARTHVDECAECREELDRLHQRVAALKALPTLSSPRDRWAVVRGAVVAERRRVWWVRSGWAAAAAIALVLGATTVMRQPAAAPETAEEVQILVQQSQQFDELLRRVGAERRVLNGWTALVIVGLEDQVALLDSRIEAARAASAAYREMADLLRERVTLMDALVNTHVQRAAYVGF